MRRGFRIACGAAAIAVLGTCRMPSRTAAPLRANSMTVTLEWDAPRAALAAPCGYRVYYRRMNEAQWILLGETDGKTSLTVAETRVGGDGEYAFGVSSLSATGTESRIHSSLDFSADPVGGWYLFWIGSQ